MAAVILHPGRTLTEAELIAFCEPRLPYFAVPRYLEFVERAAEHRERQGAEIQAARARRDRQNLGPRGRRRAPQASMTLSTMTLSTVNFDTMTPAMPHIFPTVLHMLAAAGDTAPERVALRCGEERLTYREYISCVAGFAQALGGEVRGGRVALIMPNSIDAAVATFAILAAGAQAVPLNPAYTAHELRSILADAEPSAIVCDAALQDLIGSLAAELGIGRTIVVDAGSRLTRWASQRLSLPAFPEAALARHPAIHRWHDRPFQGRQSHPPRHVDQRRATRGPAAVRRRRENPDRHADLSFLRHLHGTATRALLPRHAFDPAALSSRGCAAHDRRARHHVVRGKPDIVRRPDGARGVRHDEFRKPPASASPVRRHCGWKPCAAGKPRPRCTICEGYGQSEAGPVLTFNPRDGIRKQGSVGVPLPLTEVQIVDSETGTRPLAPNEPGEIRARGPQIMSGYRNRPEETAAALRDGWLYTGDIGAIDEDGYLFILDRKKDMAIVGGFNVYPREIEEALCAHPAVAEAAVIGVPDSYRGEALIGYVVLRQPDASESGALTSYLAERLTRYKIPRDIRICAALPKTTVGKIDKVALKAAHRG